MKIILKLKSIILLVSICIENVNTERLNSGGIVMYVRKSIKPGVSIIENHFDTIIWLKPKRHFFNFTQGL